MGLGGQRHAPAALFPGKPNTCFIGGCVAENRSGWVWKSSPPPVFCPWTVQTVANRYAD